MNQTAEVNKASILKLNSTNYQQWKFGAEMLLLKEDLWETTTEEKPEEITEAWTKKDNSARATIALSMDPSLHKLVQNCKTSKEMWGRIKSHFERISFSSRLFLKRKLLSFKLEGNKMEEYISKIMNLIDRLNNGGCRYEDEEVISIMLCGLPESFDGLIMGLEARDEKTITIEEVKHKLRDEAERREHLIQDNPHKVLTAYNPHKTNFSDRRAITCYECQGQGHVRRVCPNLYRNNRKQISNMPNYSTEIKRAQDNDTNYTTKYTNTSEEESSSTIQVNFNCESADNEPTRMKENSEYYSFISTENQEDTELHTKEDWVLDSGATNHMSYNESQMTNYTKFDKNRCVTFANGTRSQAIGTGTVRMDLNNGETMLLSDVILVPEMKVNLISISKLCQEGYSLRFDNLNCHILKDQLLITTCELINGIFMLSSRDKMGPTQIAYKACIHLWHERLGHRNLEDIQKLSKSDQIKNLLIDSCKHHDFCKTCALTKQTSTSFPSSKETHSIKVFDLIHADVCGPITPTSKGGGNYFIILTDDYSRYSYLEVLKNKHDSISAIMNYMNHFHNKFGRFPTNFRSDGGGEFQNKRLNDYLKSNGIKHQLSVPYTPQQNGTAERVNRTIISMVRAMLTGNNLPKSLWGEAASTACYLHNRFIHSHTNKVPYNLWEGRKADFKHIKTMGSKAFPLIPKAIRKHKFNETAREGILLGYSDLHKGYKIMDKTSNDITIAISVGFDENSELPKQQTQYSDENKDYLEINLPTEKGLDEDTLLTNNETCNEIRRSNRNNLGQKPIRFRD